VRRTTGLAVENQGAATVFVGQDNINLSFGGIACDIDYGNDNRTDIAFARPQAVTGTVSQTATTMADLILHEAGHTFGLYHVNSPYTDEAMGAGYSVGDNLGTNLTYLNQWFNEFLNHGGGRGPENTYQTMNGTFITGTVPRTPGAGATSSGLFHLD